jgi:hypothetical protein
MQSNHRLLIAASAAAGVLIGFTIGLVAFLDINLIPDVPLVLAGAAVIVSPTWRAERTVKATLHDLQDFLEEFGFSDHGPALVMMPALQHFRCERLGLAA